MKGVVSLVMLVAGIGFGTAAYALPSAASAPGKLRDGGVFRVALEDLDSVDPALAYLPHSWLLLDATCAKLMNYPDQRSPGGLRPVPEVATGHPDISRDGKTYTFTLRRDFRFNTGARLDADGFARQISRLLAFKSYGLPYVQDIVGADDVLAGRASSPAGVVADGSRLVIRLRRPIPDFEARLAMPFFCAVPPGLPADPEGVKALPSAGPYYIVEYLPGRRVVLRRNGYYRGKRPHHVESFRVDLASEGDVVGQIQSGRADWGYITGAPFAQRARELVRRYGLNRSRLFIRPAPSLRYLVLNTERPLFKNNARLRQAINYAVDRKKLVASFGYQSVRPTDQYLPIGFPGFRDAHIYPLRRPDVRTARALARGRLRGGKAVMYTPDRPLGVQVALVLKRNLARIGLHLEIRRFPIQLLWTKLGTRGEPFDIAETGGWATDYSDPYAFINILLGEEHRRKQLGLLQLEEVQPPDGCGVAARRQEAIPRLRQPRYRPGASRCPNGCLCLRQRSDIRLAPARSALQNSAPGTRPRGCLPEVGPGTVEAGSPETPVDRRRRRAVC